MQFEINKIPFLYFNWQFQKEIHNKNGKPNQKCGCKFKSGNLYDFKILEEWQNIIKLESEIKIGKADNLNFIDKHFEGKLPIDMNKFKGNLKYSENSYCELKISFIFNNKKLFEKLYNNKTINIILNDFSKFNLFTSLPQGNITFNIKFTDPALALQAQNLAPTLTPLYDKNGKMYFQIKTNSSILELDIQDIIDHIECENLYTINKKDNNWKYKIDVQNYLWLLGNCKYKETDDTNIVNFEFKSNLKPIKKINWKILTGDIKFILISKKEFIYNIIKNNSLEDPFCKNPFKECLSGKKIKGKSFVLGEELPVDIPYEIILGRKT